MTTITPNQFAASDFTPFVPEDYKQNHAEASRLTSSQQQKMDISIVTADGDRVTLSNGSQSNTVFSSYAGMAQNSAGFVKSSGQSLEQRASRNLSMTVVGQLDDQELKDIGKVVKKLDKIMREMMSGDMDDAMKKALKIGKFDSIASLDAHLVFSQSVSLEHAAVSQSTITKPVGLSPELSIPSESVTIDRLKDFIEAMVEQVRESDIAISHLAKPIDHSFARFFKELAEQGKESDEPKLHLAKFVRDDFFDKLEEMNEDQD